MTGNLIAFALCAVMGTDPAPEPTEPPAPPDFRPPLIPPPLSPQDDLKRLPEPEDLEAEREHERLVRVGATAAGGAVGIALPLLAGWGIQTAAGPCPTPTFFTCDHDVGMTVMTTLLPVTVGFGLGVPHALTKGRAGAGFGLAGALGGYLTAATLLGFVSLGAGQDWANRFPAAGAGLLAAFGLIGGVAGLELRHEALREGSQPWSIGRALAEGAVFMLAGGLSETVLVLLLVAISPPYGDQTLGWVLGLVGSPLALIGASAAGWGVHRAMGGHGTGWSGFVGLLASASIAGLFLGIHGHAPPKGGIFSGGAGTSPWSVSTLTLLIACVGPSIGLEWSSALNTPDNEVEPSELGPQLQAGIVPTQGGALLSLGGTF